MKIKVEIIKDRSHIKRAMRMTMGRGNLLQGETKSQLSNETFMKLLLGRHSPIEEMEFWIEMTVTERVHTHLVRHEEIGKYVSTSRPDLGHSTCLEDGERYMALKVNAKRLIEICEQRLCTAAWEDTRLVFEEVKDQIKRIDPILFLFLNTPCAYKGYCTEANTTCYRHSSDEYLKFKEVATYIKTGEMECTKVL